MSFFFHLLTLRDPQKLLLRKPLLSSGCWTCHLTIPNQTPHQNSLLNMPSTDQIHTLLPGCFVSELSAQMLPEITMPCLKQQPPPPFSSAYARNANFMPEPQAHHQKQQLQSADQRSISAIVNKPNMIPDLALILYIIKEGRKVERCRINVKKPFEN